eukprot:gene10986-14759_t
MSKTTTNTDLSIRETILGVLKAKDIEKSGVIHTSDFRSALSDLGFPYGSKVVENILVHCKLDANGNIDFNQLENALSHERKVYNTQSAIKSSTSIKTSTSSTAVLKPWRADEAHQQKVSSEIQSRNIQENRVAVNEIFRKVSHHEIDTDSTIYQLSILNINPTPEFLRLIKSSEYQDITLPDFIKSLTNSNNNNNLNPFNGQSAGAVPNRSQSIATNDADNRDIFIARKRSSVQSSNRNTSIILGGGMNDLSKEKTSLKMNSFSDIANFRNNNIKESLFSENNEKTLPLFTHSQSQMLIGTLDKKVLGKESKNNIANLPVRFNSEHRLQREQVLAAIRKLDSSELSFSDFQDKLFSIGFELPEYLLKSIRNQIDAGGIDWSKLVGQLDASVFKVNAIDEQLQPEVVNQVRQKFVDAVIKQSQESGTLDSLINLTQIFRKIDTNNDETLSLIEFKAGCRLFQLDLDDSELRLLFNSLDMNGDGVLELCEFMNIIRTKNDDTNISKGGRPGLNGLRYQIIKSVFQKLNRYAKSSVALDKIMDNFDASAHFDVINCRRTSRQVTNEFVNWFSSKKDFDGMVTQDSFEEYYSNISTLIEDDEQFTSMVKNTWKLSEKLPPPPQYHQRNGLISPPPNAKQSHGDVLGWSQELSALEEKASPNKPFRKPTATSSQRNKHSEIPGWSDSNDLGVKGNSSPTSDMKLQGGIKKTSRGNTSTGTKSLMGWHEPSQREIEQEVQARLERDALILEELSLNNSNNNDNNNIKKSNKKLFQKGNTIAEVRPYGMDEIESKDNNNNNSQNVKIKSLADTIKAKQKPKSLSEVLNM